MWNRISGFIRFYVKFWCPEKLLYEILRIVGDDVGSVKMLADTKVS